MNALRVSKDKTLYSYLTRIDREAKLGGTRFGDLNRLNENVWGKNFAKLTPNERRVRWDVQRVLKDDIKSIQETTSIPVWDAYETAMEKSKIVHQAESADFVQKLFKRSMRFEKEKGISIFYPEIFKRQVEGNQGQLALYFKKTPENLEIINNYADMMLGATRDLGKYWKQKPTSLLEKMATRGGAAVGAYYGAKMAMEHPLATTALIVPYGFETWMAHSLAHPRGWLKKMIYAEPMKGMRQAIRPMALGTPLGVKSPEETMPMP